MLSLSEQLLVPAKPFTEFINARSKHYIKKSEIFVEANKGTKVLTINQTLSNKYFSNTGEIISTVGVKKESKNM